MSSKNDLMLAVRKVWDKRNTINVTVTFNKRIKMFIIVVVCSCSYFCFCRIERWIGCYRFLVIFRNFRCAIFSVFYSAMVIDTADYCIFLDCDCGCGIVVSYDLSRANVHVIAIFDVLMNAFVPGAFWREIDLVAGMKPNRYIWPWIGLPPSPGDADSDKSGFIVK